MSNWLSETELAGMFGRFGREAKVSRGVTVFGSADNIHLGDNVRIDHGVVILASRGHLQIGSHVHIATGAVLLCTGGVDLGDFTAVGFGSRLISASDDFSGDFLIGPLYDEGYTKVRAAPIAMERGSVLGAGCTILPGVTMAPWSAAGAGTLLRRNTVPFGVYVGTDPRQCVRERRRGCENLANAWDIEWRKRHGY